MQHIEYWLIRFIQAPQFKWIALIIVGLVLVEIVLNNKDEGCRRAAGGISSCFGLFCVYVLTALFFGPLHYSFLEKLELSSCLPFLSEGLTTTRDWAVFSFFRFPEEMSDLCYGILKLFLICLLYNLVDEIIEKHLKEKCGNFWAWTIIQAVFIFMFTLLISSFNYIIRRLCYYVSWFESIIQFIRENATIVCICIALLFILVIIIKVIVSVVSSISTEDIPILGAVTNVFFGNTFGISLIKATITTYFVMLVFKIISMTYIRDFVLSDIGQIVLLSLIILVFMWYMIRQKFTKKD